MNRKVLLLLCMTVMFSVSCRESDKGNRIRLYLADIGLDCPFSPDEYHLYPGEMVFSVSVENHTDSTLTIRHDNRKFSQKGMSHGYFQWIMDADTLTFYSNGTYLELPPDSIFSLGAMTTRDSIFLSKFNVEERNDTMGIKRNWESLIQRSRMRFVPITEDYMDIPEGHTVINSPMEIDMSSFYIDYLLGGSGYLHLEYNNGQLHYKGWDPSNAQDL